ncbi:MAG: hypothetical protein ACO3LF_02735 [Candidatus Kariarchaeum pelagius]
MIFFKLIIFIFFFLVSNNVFGLPDCADDQFSEPSPSNIADGSITTSEPGNNCNFYIDGEEMPICASLSNPDSRINCINLADLPSCLTLSDPKPLRNCIRIGDGKSNPTAPHDICEIDPNNPSQYDYGKNLDLNCVNLCYTNNPSDGPENCVERKYHHYLYKSPISSEPENLSYLNHRIASRDVSKRNQLQYSCRKLTAGELKYFNDEFSTIDCGKLREIDNNSVRIKRIITDLGPDLQPNTADDQFENIDEKLFSNLNGYVAKNNIADLYKPGEICRYRKCNNEFGINIISSNKIEEQKEKNNSVQISADILENGNYINLKNCSNDPDHSFIAEDKIVCKNDRKCYNFTSDQIEVLVSSPNAVEKCLAKSKNTESIAKCFLSLEPMKMCRLHSTIGPNCANICGNVATDIPGINCFNDSNKPNPMINCNYHSVIDGANYIDDSSVDWNSDELNSYKSKFLTVPNPTDATSSIPIDYTALEYANLAFNSQDQSPDYFKHDKCNDPDDPNVINECATDCNYVADPNSRINKSCLERFKSESTTVGDQDANPALDYSNQKISNDIHNDANNHWFYRPYPLVDRCTKGQSGDCLDGNRQFRNVVKWSNASWGSNYNGSLFVFNNGTTPNDLDVSITPRTDRGNLSDKYQREFDNNEIARGAYFHRLCLNWTNMIDLEILDYGEIVLKTAAITAAASAVAAPFILVGGPVAVAAVFAITYDRLINEINLDKFISPKQCFAPRINVRTNHLGSSAISGYNGADADNNDREHYEFQYDEIDITRNFIETYDPIVTSNDRFKIEFSSENDFDQSNNRIIDDGILKKIILLKDGYIKGGVVHDYSERNVHKYRVRACMRFDGGARSCNTSCNLLGFCHKQNCGYDQCVDLYVTDDDKSESIYRCSASIKDGNGWRRKTDEEFRFPEDNYEDEDPNYPGLMKNEEKFCAKEITSREIVTGQSGIIRLRAVAYPERYICVFADAAHGNGESDDGDEIWRVRGLIPVVSIPYTGLPNLEDGLEPNSSPHPRQFCLRYGMNIDNSSTQVTNNCRENVESNCEPSLQAASDKKENIDNFISDNYPLSDDQKSKHKEYKAAIFNDFQKNLSITSISNQYSKPDDNVYETDFFNPAILVNYGSELATTSLPTGCIGGYEKFNDQVSNTPSSSAHSSIGKGHIAGRSLPSSTLTTASNVVTITNYSKCQHSSYTSDITFPDDTFSHMSFSANRKNIKKSTDGVLQLSANQYSDLTGLNYEKILYLKKGFSQGRPSVGLYKYNGSNTDYFLNQFTIYRKLPNYDNINLNYDRTSGKFSIQLQNKKESDYTTRLPEVELDVDPSDSNSNIESLISGEKCFDLSNDDNKARLEYMKFCLKPDECSNLFDICIENNLFSSVVKGSLWDKCFGDDNNSLINKCGAKWGLNPAIDDDGKRDIMNNMISKIKSYRSHNSNTNLYGWNHEVCLDPKSYNKVKVAAYKAENNMGKCILDPVLNGNASIDDNGTPNNILDDTINLDSGATFNYNSECSDFGGDESVSCHCLKLPTGSDYNLGEKKINFLIDNNHITLDEYYLRDATPRELGLCFDKELPLECQSNKVDDGNYVGRTGLVDTYHAEYSHVFIPYSEFETGSIVKGECKKNWKVQEGVPMMKCIKDPADSSRGKFENIMLKINFTPSITISGDTTIINLLDANGKKRPELRDIELNMLFPDNILQHAASHNIILNPDSENEEVPIHNIANQNPKIDLTNGSFEIANSNISDTTIINSIAINYSLQGRCVRPKCITDTTSIPVGSHPYYNIKNNEPEGGYYVNDFYSGSNLVDASDNPIDNNLPLKGSKSGYAYWDKNDLNIDAQDLDQTISALSCFDGFETSPNGLPELTCSPEGNINITLTGNNVKNSCIRKECSTPTDLTSTSAIDSNLIEKYFGANFKVFDLNSHPLKASRSTNSYNFDFSVTLKEERSSVTSQCYYNISEGITYVKSSNNAPDPRLACDSAGNIVNLYSNSCIKAGCEAIPDNSPVNLGRGNFVYQGSNYQKPTMASYMTSDNQCPSGYVEYPYDIPYKYSDIATLDQATGSVTINDNDIITGGTKPIRSCYITTSDDINNNTTDWQGSDNPCVRGCIGANTFRENFGSNTDSDDIANITSGITHEYRSDCNGQPCNIITINQDLSSTPPKEIIYSNSSKINIKANRNSIYITYPPKHDGYNGPENTKILLFGDSSNFRGIDPSQTPSEISVINRINVGVTTHLVSTDGGKEIKIEWNDASFNSIQYAYFDDRQPFHCYNSSGNLVDDTINEHCDFYATNCSDKNSNKRAGCGLINISDDSNDLPEGYFKAGRVDGRFLLARECNDNGIWSKIDGRDDDFNPSNAKNAATPLVLANGRFDKEGNEYKKKFSDTYKYFEEGDLLVSEYYNNNNIDGNNLTVITNGFSPKIKQGAIENNGDYSMASSENHDKKYSIKLAKFEVANAIDKLSLFDINSTTKPNIYNQITIREADFDTGNADAESYKLCTKDDIQNRIKYDETEEDGIIVSNDVGESNSNSVISEGDIFIVRDTNTLEIKTYPETGGKKMIHNNRGSILSLFPTEDNGLVNAAIDSGEEITLENKIVGNLYLKGQSIEYNYCREGWDNYPIGSNYPTATCGDGGQWIINGNDNCKKRCTVDNMAFERKVNADGEDHQQTTKLNITGVMKHEEFFDFIFIMQYKSHNHEIRGKYICDNGNLNDQSSVHHRGEDTNICETNGYNYVYNMGGANTSNHIDNDSYRFYNYMRPDTISYQGIGCDGNDCDWMGDDDDYGQWYYNIDCQRNINGFGTSMP